MNLTVQANMEPRVVLEERSGTIIIGGNVKLAPCAIAQGNISVQVTDEFNYEAGPTASGGVGASGSSGNVKATEEKAQITVLRPNTTVADLAQIFQSLKLSASDIMAILENLRAQGALKAKLVMQ
jgi:flagellar P-ring protein precursor FlgI